MWPFTKATTPPRQPTDQVDELERRVKSLEADMRQLELEWTDTYEKMDRMTKRLSKRAERAAKKDETEDEPPMNPAAARLLGRV